MRSPFLFSIASLLLLAAPAFTGGEDTVLINFESLPGETTTIADGTRITTQFEDEGVSFFMTTDSAGPQITRLNLTGQSGANGLGGAGGTFEDTQAFDFPEPANPTSTAP